MNWSGPGFDFELGRRTLVMGIVNVTPDSFSDGGLFRVPGDAISQALRLIEYGADVLDIGGESTRPGADPVTPAEELARVLPVIEAIRTHSDIAISIDTTKPVVARTALAAGANVVNDVSALRDPAMASVVSEARSGLILMHMLGDPKTMQEEPRYDDVVTDVRDFLAQRAAAALNAGVPRAGIAIDPGIGFGKTLEHNLRLLKNLGVFAELGFPLLVGPSRKRFIGEITGAAVDDRLPGSMAAAVQAAIAGAHIVRVHDVAETVMALRVVDAIRNAEK